MIQKTYARSLDDNPKADSFLRGALYLDDKYQEEELNQYVRKLVSAEIQKNGVMGKDTLTHIDHRATTCCSDSQRKLLRSKIYKELTTKPRLKNDDNIKMGRGGALPTTPLQHDKKAFYVIGLPASGKSEVSNQLSDQFGAIILDSDYAKRKFPEYKSDYGAIIVHEESSVVVFGGKDNFVTEPSVLQYAIKNNCNIVIPKVGDVYEKVFEFNESLNRLGYEVHLILVRLDRSKATQRAFHRFIKTGRYVSLSMIFDVYGNDPTITFYDLMMKGQNVFKSYTMLSSDVPLGHPKDINYASKFSPFF